MAINAMNEKESAIKEANMYFALHESQPPCRSHITMFILAYVIVVTW
jgi:hypothetical protein